MDFSGFYKLHLQVRETSIKPSMKVEELYSADLIVDLL